MSAMACFRQLLQACIFGATFVRVKLIGLLLIMAGALYAQVDVANLDEGFDKPLKKTVLDLGPSPLSMPSRQVRNKLRCYYYPTFTVKEYDTGEKGAEWLSLVPYAQAACVRKHTEDERVYTREWSGYFWGAKGTSAFFIASDGDSGGTPFAVFDVRTGRKLFEDSSLLDYYKKKLHIKDTFRITSGPDEIPRFTYFRVVPAGCNLKAQQWECWKKVRVQFGITQTDLPVCSGYEQADWESVIVYPVSVVLTNSPQIKAADGPAFCWPEN